MNKKDIILILVLAVFLPLSLDTLAQNEEDALRYSQLFDAGLTARSLSMGGAFGALGADMSEMSINPAGIAVYRRSVFSITPTYMYDNTHATYLGKRAYDSNSHFSLGNIGMVYTYNTGQDNGWVNFNFGFSSQKRTDFYKNMTISAINDHSSMLDYFADYADGKTLDMLDDYGEGLAFDTWLIDTVSGNPTQYETVLSQYGDFPNSTYGESQRRQVSTYGNITETNFNISANYGYKFYVGGTFTIRSLNYHHKMKHSEDDLNNEIFDFNYFDYIFYLNTRGTAYAFSMGAIFRPVPILRLGAAFHFPTVYKLHDSYSSIIESGFDTPDDEGYSTYSSESPDGYYDYKLNTPFRFIGSVGFQIKKLGVVSMDYEYIDYPGMKFQNRGDNYDFSPTNENIRSAYKGTSNIKAGGEIHFGSVFLRCGVAYYGSPYRSAELNKNASSVSYSTGIGYKTRMFSVDFGYAYLTHTENYVLYPNNDRDYASTWSGRHRVSGTISFNF